MNLEQKLLQRSHDFLSRTKTEIEETEGPYVIFEGKKYLSFSSNNYLGLAKHPKVVKACQSALIKYGVGSGSAYLISGYTSFHRELEEKLAEFLGYPKVLLFSSGYMANSGIIQTLFSKGDFICADKLCHASLIDGCIASKANFKRYLHCKTDSLEKFCSEFTNKNSLIVTEGLFGMDGTIAPLDKISSIAAQHKSLLLVDDAHAIGILGNRGRGSIEHHNLTINEIPILVGTLGKAFGSYGAFVASHPLIIESLIQMTRTYLFTTAIPPAIAAASLASLEIIQEENDRRTKLNDLIAYFKKCAIQLGLTCTSSQSPIQPIIIGCNQKTLNISQRLLIEGFFVKPIRWPTVPKSTARLRITLTADHSHEHIDLLLESLSNAIKSA